MKLCDIHFVDLYLGENLKLFKGLKDSPNLSDPAPPALKSQLEELLRSCRLQLQLAREPEFSMVIDDIMYRVTMMNDVTNSMVFILRRSTAEVRPIEQIGLAPVHIRDLVQPGLEGLVLVVGRTGAGKTSTAVSILDARLHRLGGVAVAIEDPPEVNINGIRGLGRCIQVRASRKSGGFKEHLVRALRSNPDLIFLGEVREEAAAAEAVNASLNGHMILTTIHAGNITQAIERLASSASPQNPRDAYQKLSHGLKMVIWQDLVRSADGTTGYRYEALSLIDREASSGARHKIAQGALAQLADDIDQQMRRVKLNPLGVESR